MSEIGIQAAPSSEAIHAGVLSKDGTTFIAGGPQDVTDAAIVAVSEFSLKHYGGRLGVSYTHHGKRRAVLVTVMEEEGGSE